MIWILWHRRIGDLKQMQVLADALGGPVIVKKLEFSGPEYAPLAAFLLKSDALSEPWPELVISAEAMASVIARDLKKKLGGAIKVVCLARPSGDVRDFDLVLTSAQYRLPKLANVIELALPLTVKPVVMETKGKFITVLIGASSPPEVLDATAAVNMLARLRAYADTKNLPLCVVTSPRTAAGVVRVFSDNLQSPHQVHVWNKNSPNPYQQSLNDAVEIVVTSDSASMLADAVVTGKSVYAYRLPRALSVLQRVVSALYMRWPQAWIFRTGIIEASTDRWLLIERLVALGHVSWFGDARKEFRKFDPQKDIDTAVAAVKKLLTLP
jgi:uncharacterized protein